MNIAICDDDQIFCQQLEECVQQLFKDNSQDFECEIFYSGESMLSFVEKNQRGFQIYLLDIGMAGMDGIGVAEVIRQKDLDAIIIFVTSHEAEMPRAFDVLAFHYLVKPLDEKQVFRVLSSAVYYIHKKRTVFQYPIRRQVNTILLAEVAYFESVSRKIRIHTTKGEVFEYYGTLKDVERQAGSFNFSRIHKSYLVNLECIQRTENQTIMMRDQTVLSISRRYHQLFHRAFRRYLLGSMKQVL
ncbi:LytR/AlgR family response regulator transcription factor [Enterococcus pallens]|uniref:Stage 0 sporulation protein A homolog n=1 Tax=Enterococcus pallens ATCC BAA-351 TaxID=1158607 RepID=R2SNT1_9ENTE|nr:LytTR family DNA-binding domain-containing protein [Enterococcus pallens]EOH94491.1 hypothetical protein UAU_02226 [Enterococcus pallens ATCC BAA-351]EOU24370.1 hypothetical protein I588_00357 [Enterococcus pallens ATCC BAA-351]OJG76902.1 hypothetical protein RV10_GL003149 [Enterococcus pallens]